MNCEYLSGNIVTLYYIVHKQLQVSCLLMIDRIDCMDLGRADMSMTRLLIHCLMYLYIYISTRLILGYAITYTHSGILHNIAV